jgi:hypothetical protein
MASELSNYLADEILDWFKGADMPTAPTTVYVALFDGDPTAAGTSGTEVTTDIRAAGRLAITWGSITGRAISNSANIDFGTSAGDADVTHAAIFDAATGGNMLCYTALDNARTIVTGDPVVIPSGDLNVNFN